MLQVVFFLLSKLRCMDLERQLIMANTACYAFFRWISNHSYLNATMYLYFFVIGT